MRRTLPLLASLALVLVACGDDDGGSNTNQNTNNTNGNTNLNANTNANTNTNTNQAPLLTSGHTGWDRADCASGGCHTLNTIHSGAYDWPDCAGCWALPKAHFPPAG